MPVSIFEREETNIDIPFAAFREKSSQRLIYTRKTSNLTTELNYRHTLYCDFNGVAPERNFLHQASFKAYNLSNPLEFKAGRIITGNNNLQTIDGASWHYPCGNRLKLDINVGSISNVDTSESGKPSFAEGRAHYALNDDSYFVLKTVRQFNESYSGIQLGYNIQDLRISGEYLSGTSTDTARLSLQYLSPKAFDLTSDYTLVLNDKTDSSVMRHYAGVESGELYFEAGLGNCSWFDLPDKKDCWFYDGSISWQSSKRDNAAFGFITETDNASTSKTLYARAERHISHKTTFSLGVEDTRFEHSDGTIQNLDGKLYRRVDWGYVEFSAGMISGGQDSDLNKDIRLRVGYEF